MSLSVELIAVLRLLARPILAVWNWCLRWWKSWRIAHDPLARELLIYAAEHDNFTVEHQDWGLLFIAGSHSFDDEDVAKYLAVFWRLVDAGFVAHKEGRTGEADGDYHLTSKGRKELAL